MRTIYHILGSDIPHHNNQVLSFFQNELLPDLPEQQHIFYAVSQEDLDYSKLNLQCFSDKKSLAKAVIATAEQDPTAFFILHGQYNLWIWLVLFCGKLPACRTAWHIWGADLYETASGWKAKLFYAFRRQVQKKILQVWATQGDLHYFWQHIRPKSDRDQLIYFPTKMFFLNNENADFFPLREKCPTKSRVGGDITILLGNSGDRSNNHIQALNQIYQQFGAGVRLILPMGYPANNEPYICKVETYAKRLFPQENLQILREKIDFADYLKILTACDLGYFNFERQQGVGTICLLIQQKIPFVLNSHNPFILDLKTNKVPFLQSEHLSFEKIVKTKSALSQIDANQLSFFPEQYLKMWKRLLNLVANQK